MNPRTRRLRRLKRKLRRDANAWHVWRLPNGASDFNLGTFSNLPEQRPLTMEALKRAISELRKVAGTYRAHGDKLWSIPSLVVKPIITE